MRRVRKSSKPSKRGSESWGSRKARTVRGGERVVPSSMASVTSPNGAAVCPPPIPPSGNNRVDRMRCSTTLQIECGIAQFGEPGSMIARKLSVKVPEVMNRTLATSRITRASNPCRKSERSSSSQNSSFTRIELACRRNQVNDNFALPCPFLCQPSDLPKHLSGGNNLSVAHRDPLVGVLLRQLVRMVREPLLVRKIPLRYRRWNWHILRPIFGNTSPLVQPSDHHYSPHARKIPEMKGQVK